MILRQRFEGSDAPFEGERRLTLGNVPAGAKVLHARAVVSPVRAADGAPPVETLAFAGEAWGATRVRHAAGMGLGWVEVDFHARRTLHSVVGTGLAGATVEIDLGGAFAAVKNNGTLLSPGEPGVLELAADEELLPGLTVARFRISHKTASPDLALVRVRGVPRNVSLGLGAAPPFFTAPGELARSATVEDFTSVLTTFLAGDAPRDGFHRVPLVLRSDALGRVAVEVEVELLHEQSVLPAGLDEVIVPYAFGAVPEGGHGVLEVALPPGARVRGTEGRVVGAFEESRVVLGPIGEVPPDPASVPLAPDRAQAQRLVLAGRLEVSAVDLLLAAVSRRARLEVDLLEDLDGRPGGGSRLPRPAAFTLERETVGGPTWISVALGTQVQLEDHDPERSWLAVKVLEGEALWFVADDAPAAAGRLQSTTDGALSWRRSEATGVAAPAALFRLRHVPDTFRMPVELQVGAGPAARRVRFDSQEARGRVELDLGVPEIAEAFNEVLAAGAGACAEGEHLDNPDFERWFAVGDALGAPERIPLDLERPGASLVAPSPDGRWAYVVTGVDDGATGFHAVDLICLRMHGPVRLASEPPVGLAVHPARHRVFIALGRSLHVVDLAGPRLLGSSSVRGRVLTGLALSRDGKRLFVASVSTASDIAVRGLRDARVEALAAADLEAAALAGTPAVGPGLLGDPGLPGAAFLAPPLDLTVSADGSRLFVVEGADAAGVAGSRLHALDAHTLSPAAEPVAVPPGTGAVAAGVDGRLLVSVNPGGSLELRDAETLRRVAGIAVPRGARRLALEPGGRRAFVASAERVSVVDLGLRRLVQDLDGLGAPLSHLAVTPDGGHLVVAAEGDVEAPTGALVVLPIGSPFPEEWAVTGPVRRECVGGSGAVLVLGSGPGDRPVVDGPFGLSQVAPVAAGCRYELTFDGAATVEDARVEVAWMVDSCQPAETVSLPVPRVVADPRSLPRSIRSLTAPPGATQAEVRLRLPDGAAAVAGLSLVATADTLENGRFLPSPGGVPAGWELVPGAAVGFGVSATPDGGVHLMSGASPVTLAQTVQVEPGRLFELTVAGGRGASGTAGPGAELALRWASAAGEPVGEPLTLALSQAAAPAQARGTVPEGAGLARLELRLPAGMSVAVERLAFALREPRSTAAVFIAQAPGELRIRDWRIAYEPGEPARPEAPEAGLCAPTPPGREAGEACDEEAACPGCKKAAGLRGGGEHRVSAAGRAVVVGACASCGTPQVRYGGRPAPRAERFTPRSVPSVGAIRRGAAGTATAPRPLRLFGGSRREVAKEVRPAPPLTAIRGIGDKRAGELEALGIDSVRKLARASPDLLDGRLTGAARPLVEDLIAQARRLTD